MDIVRKQTAQLSVVDMFSNFIQTCQLYKNGSSLTVNSETSDFAFCFGIFSVFLIRNQFLFSDAHDVANSLRENIRKERARFQECPKHKSYRQLLAFSLSALATLGLLNEDPLDDLIVEQVTCDVAKELYEQGCLDGRAGSGNHAMFLAIFLLHAKDKLGLNMNAQIDLWVELHLKHMNRFGFWGVGRGITHLQFQNGYHQHEILEYLGVENPRSEATISAVRSLADAYGHFAPYPGGGGCYDYDAVFMLTPGGRIPDSQTRGLLIRTAESIIASQNKDGGFCESQNVRPRSLANLWRFALHIFNACENHSAMKERLRYGLALQRIKHNRIHTHWSRYSRRWDESDLWDSWFRMLTLARIEVALDPSKAVDWGFINNPGIGYHPSLRATPTTL